MQNVLVTGATGFLGSAVSRYLIASDIDVRCTGRSVENVLGLPNYQPINLLESGTLHRLVHGVQCVVHAAGLAHRFRRERRDEHEFFKLNVAASEAMARAANSAGVEHFVLISSASVYGNHPGRSVAEETDCRPEGPYAHSKYEAEIRVARLAKQTGMKLTILRLATLYGEGDPGNVARLMRAIDQRQFRWIGNGENFKTLVHCDDAARAVVLAVQRGAYGSRVATYNIAAPPVQMREVVDGLAAHLVTAIPRLRIPPRLIHLPLKVAASWSPTAERANAMISTINKWLSNDIVDGNKFRQEFNFVPSVSLRDGLRREVHWYGNADKNFRSIRAA